MGVIYQTDSVRVFTSIFSSAVKVREKSTGRTVVASATLSARCAELCRAVEDRQLTQLERAFVIEYIFERFAGSALNPEALGASMFMSGSTDSIISPAILALRGHDRGIFHPATAPLNSTVRRYDLSDGGVLWLDSAKLEARVAYGRGEPQEADQRDVKTYFAVAEILLDRTNGAQLFDCLDQARRLLSLSALNHRREREFLRETDPESIAITMMHRAALRS